MKSLRNFLLGFWLILVLLAGCQGGGEVLQADAGEDLTVRLGEKPQFDGCASTGKIASYTWTIIKAGEKMPEDEGKVLKEAGDDCAFSIEAPMGEDELGFWVVELSVDDAAGNVSTDQVRVDVVP